MSKVKATMAYTFYFLHTWATLSVAFRGGRSSTSKSYLFVTGGVLTLSGLLLYAASVREFNSFRQLSGLVEGELVTGGVYRYTRNPQIVGWGMALMGIAVAGRSLKAFALVALYFLAHRLYFLFEERDLERAFGEEYLRYLERTPRFLGVPIRNGLY